MASARLLRVSLLSLALLLLAAPAAAAQKRIIGGSNVSITAHPYQVQVLTSLGDCGGSIRDATHVITAAHCVVNEDLYFPLIVDPADVIVGYGASDQRDLEPIGVERVSVHRGYLRDLTSSEFDVAVLTLAAPIDLSGPNARAIVPASDAELDEGFDPANPADPPIRAFATGWGATEEEGGTGSNLLQGVSLPLRADAACAGVYGSGYSAETMLCAGGEGSAPAGNPDTCLGDSGGPLAMDVDRSAAVSYKLIGVTSFGEGCGRPNTPGVYAWVRSPQLFPFLYAAQPAAPPPFPGAYPTVSGTPRVGATLTCNAPPLAGATVASYLWSVYEPAADAFTLVAVRSGPTLTLTPATQGARLVCDARYENDGGFNYSEAPGAAAVGPVLPALTAPRPNPPVVADTTPPSLRIGRVRCGRGRCTVKVSASDTGGLVRSLSAKLTYKVKRCRTSGGRRRCKSVTRTKRLRPRKTRGGFTITTRLKPGRYTLSAVATDTSNNRSRTARKTFRVKRR